MKFEINIYWNDLSEDGKNSLLENGFVLTEEIENESTPVGVLNVGAEELK